MNGIYAIINKLNKKQYIGQSKNIEKRWEGHKKELNKNCHCNRYLQHAWNKYGQSIFEFIILEECLLELLDEKEIYWCDTLKSYYNQNGYNIRQAGTGKLAEISKNLLSKAQKGKRKGKDNHFYGKTHSEETRKKISEKLKVSLLGEGNPFYGKSHSEETKAKIAKKLKGTEPGNKIKFDKNQIKDFIKRINNKETLKSIAGIYSLGVNTITKLRNRLIEEGKLDDCRNKKKNLN